MMWSCLSHFELPSLVQTLCLVIVVLGAKFILLPLFQRLFTPKVSKLQVENWKKDKVYFFQFPRSPCIPNVSPFCLKVETYLRVKKIDYEVHDMFERRSKYGLLPFIELNGEHIADSQLIIMALEKTFGEEVKLTTQDKVFARFLDRFVDQHTFFCLNKFRFDNYDFAGFVVQLQNVPAILRPIAQWILNSRLQSKIRPRIALGLGRFSDSEFRLLLERDLQILSDFLSEKKFFFGDFITYADCTVFSQLAVVYYIPVESYGKQLLREKQPSLVQFMENVRAEVWPDDFTM